MRINKFIIAGAVLFCASHPANADKVFAHSKSLGMSFTAIGDPWCGPEVTMQVTASDAGKFASSEYNTIIQKLGHVLIRECPEASALSITGMAGGKTAWTGNAARANGWVAEAAGAAPVTTPPGSPPPPTETAVTTPPSPPAADSPPPVTETAVATPPSPPATASPSPAVKPAVTAGETTAPEPAEAARAMPGTAATPAPVAESAADITPRAEPAMEIAGWKPDTRVAATDDSGRMQEIPAQEGNCKIRTLVEIKPEFKPAYKMNREYDCINGYARSSQHKRHDRATLYYDGQSQPFTRIDGFWFAGYSLDRGFPKQIASLYNVKQPGGYRNTTGTDKMLVWVGEDRELRTHYFATYTHSGARWALDGTPLIVLTDNEELKNDPGKTSLAQSLAEVYKDFLGYQSTDRFSSVPFVIVDKLHEAPGQSYQQALRDSNPDASFYKAGNAMRYRGMPWVAEVKTDFTAKREAFALAEQKRIEAEKQRIAQLRARHQAGLDKQYQQLATATRYDQVRFYATLMLASSQMDAGKINFSSNYTYYANPLAAAVNLSHPAQYLNGVSNGKASTGAPLYMIIAADDGEIEKPYPMIVGQNLTAEEIDDWMLVKTGPEFGFGYDDDGKPVFEITIEQAIACKSDKCLNEMDPATMMKSWYNDTDMDFSMATGQ